MEAGSARMWSAVLRMTAAMVLVVVVIVVYLRTTAAPPPARAVTAGPHRTIVDVSFADARRGSVEVADVSRSPGTPGVDDISYVTSDGGATWRRGSHLDYVTPNLVVEQATGATGPDRISADGGKTWAALTVPDPRALVPAPPQFVDPVHGWWLLRQVDGSTPSATLWRTADGGRSWSPLPGTGVPPGDVLSVARFLDPIRGVVVAAGSDGTPAILVTGDGGLTWRPVVTLNSARPGYPQVSVALVARESTLVAWLAAYHVYADANQLVPTDALVSTDGGLTWSAPRSGPELQGPFGAPVFDDRGRLLFLGDRRLWVSADEGLTWTPRVIQVPAGVLPVALALAGETLLARASAHGAGTVDIDTLLRSTDGGTHWHRVPLP